MTVKEVFESIRQDKKKQNQDSVSAKRKLYLRHLHSFTGDETILGL